MHAPSRSLSELPPISPSTNPRVGTTVTAIWADPIKPPEPISSRPGRTHQRSRTAVDLPPLVTNTSRTSLFSPFKSSQKSRSPSPPKSPTHEVDDLDFADEERSGIKLERKGNKIASWFNGTSEPINVGLLPSPAKEEQKQDLEKLMDSRQPSEVNLTGSARPSERLQKRNSEGPAKPQLTLAARGLSFFKSKPTAEGPMQQEAVDDLTRLDVTAALFPAGPADEFSPAAFKNLQMNAEGTIKRFQTALSQSLSSLREVRSERNVQSDELEAAQTKSEHLKLQLEEMAERAAMQEKALRDLAEELAAERKLRQEEEAFRRRSLRMVTATANNPEILATSAFETPTHSNSHKRRNRISADSSSSITDATSDLGDIASDVSSSAASSIFSRPDHPVSSPTPSSPYFEHPRSSPELAQVVKFSRPFLPQNQSQLQVPNNNNNTTTTTTTHVCNSDQTPTTTHFQPSSPLPDVSGRVAAAAAAVHGRDLRPQDECQICHGIPASDAWDVVGILKEESKALKETIAHLEGGLDSTLDFLGGLV